MQMNRDQEKVLLEINNDTQAYLKNMLECENILKGLDKDKLFFSLVAKTLFDFITKQDTDKKTVYLHIIRQFYTDMVNLR